MAAPLIVNVQPRGGPTGGRTLVEITANNLRLPPEPPPTGQTSGILLQTVQVLFGTAEATQVDVFSKGRLTCLAPVNDQGLADVTIKNLDNNGDPIAGEEATRSEIYLYSRPNLTVQADFTRLIRTLIRKLKQQVLDEVVLTEHTDYDDDVADMLNIVNIAKLPSLILIGPDVFENRFFSTNERSKVPLNDGKGTIAIRRSPYTVDIQFEIVGVDDSKQRLLNLMASTIQWLNRNKFIAMDRDPDDLSLGTVEYELDFLEEGGEPTGTSRLNNSNIRSFSGKIVIRGFDIEDLAGVAEDMVVEKATEVLEIEIEDTAQLNPSMTVIPSHGD
jgi:hypothetical protein